MFVDNLERIKIGDTPQFTKNIMELNINKMLNFLNRY